METTGITMTLVNDEGVFKLQEPVPLALKTRPILHVRIVEEDEAAASEAEARAAEESWKNIEELIGCLDDKDGATDVSTNHDRYLYGDLRPR